MERIQTLEPTELSYYLVWPWSSHLASLTKKGKVFSMLYQHYWTMIGDQLMAEK